MNIIFMGTPEFAVPSLEILFNSHHKILAVVTVPDKAKGRGLRVSHSEVKEYALLNKLNLLQPESLKDKKFIKDISQLKPDLIAVVAFRILPKEVYSIPRFGSINLHASLLPKYRGAAPVNWAIINGEKETGVTTFFLQEKVDTGSIIEQNYCDIAPEDDAGTLHDKLMRLGALTLYSTVNLIESTGGYPPVNPQTEFESSPAPKIFRDNCRIEWNKPAEDVYNFIRGLSPYPAAFTKVNGKTLKIFKTLRTRIDTTEKKRTEKPGKFVVEEDRLYVCSIDEKLEILELQIEGKKRMNTADFLNGYRDIFK
jgi:methionyl-tRNA formyltransferase